jgi:hypothetical protein
LEWKEKIETVPIFLTIQTNSDRGCMASFGLWITIPTKMAKKWQNGNRGCKQP